MISDIRNGDISKYNFLYNHNFRINDIGNCNNDTKTSNNDISMKDLIISLVQFLYRYSSFWYV